MATEESHPQASVSLECGDQDVAADRLGVDRRWDPSGDLVRQRT